MDQFNYLKEFSQDGTMPEVQKQAQERVFVIQEDSIKWLTPLLVSVAQAKTGETALPQGPAAQVQKSMDDMEASQFAFLKLQKGSVPDIPDTFYAYDAKTMAKAMHQVMQIAQTTPGKTITLITDLQMPLVFDEEGLDSPYGQQVANAETGALSIVALHNMIKAWNGMNPGKAPVKLEIFLNSKTWSIEELISKYPALSDANWVGHLAEDGFKSQAVPTMMKNLRDKAKS